MSETARIADQLRRAFHGDAWHGDSLLEILDGGSNKARKVAQGTMERVREAVFGWEKKRKEIGGAAAKA